MRQAVAPVAAGAGGLIAAYAVASPSGRPLLVLLLGAFALLLALSVAPEVLIAGSLLVLGVSSALDKYSIGVGAATLYVTDLLLLVLLCRAVLPRSRRPSSRALSGAPILFFSLWSLVIVIASIRGLTHSIPIDRVIRRETAVIYFPLLFFAYSRILRERTLVPRMLWRDLAGVVIGLAGWMLLMRLIHHPFETPGNTKLGTLVTSQGESVRRDYGFASAFILYPILGVVGLTGTAFRAQPRRRWLMVTLIGIFGTMLTLVRGEIFSLTVAAMIVLLLRSKLAGGTARLRTALQVAFVAAATAFTILVVNPSLGHAIIERSLPGLEKQSATAQSTAEYRFNAFRTGIETARAHPNGLGVLDEQTLAERNIPPDYLAHSGPTYLLVDGGWPALVSALLAIGALIVRSFRVATTTPWIHPAFVGTMIMLALYSFGAAGIAGDVWVIGPAALAIALRFVAGTSSADPVERPVLPLLLPARRS